MAACDDDRPWSITLRVDGDPGREESITIANLVITNGAIQGKVYHGPEDPGNFMSDLRGLCIPAMIAGQPDMSHLEFAFNVIDALQRTRLLILRGIALVVPGPDSPRQFRGSFRTFMPYSGPLVVCEELVDPPASFAVLTFDEGDTGTGTGTQT